MCERKEVLRGMLNSSVTRNGTIPDFAKNRNELPGSPKEGNFLTGCVIITFFRISALQEVD
jgi:hypothetical protein